MVNSNIKLFNPDILETLNDFIDTNNTDDKVAILEYLKTILPQVYTDKYIFDDILYQYIYYVLDNKDKRYCFNPTQKMLNRHREIVKELLLLPQYEQRSEEWYLDRYNKITASDCNNILTSKSKEHDVMMKKIDPLNTGAMLEGDAILHGKEF